MFRNWIVVALRNLLKHRLYSAITIVGLGVGLAAAILILLFVRNELTHDRFFTEADRLHHLALEAQLPGRAPDHVSVTSAPMAAALKEGFPEVADTARVAFWQAIVRNGEKQFLEGLTVADPSFFRLFDFPFRSGDRATSLDDPTGIVLTAAMAEKYFGDVDPVGQVLTLDGTHAIKVTGVLEPLPANTHFNFDLVVPFSSPVVGFPPAFLENWGALSVQTYAKLAPGASAAAINVRIPGWMQQAAPVVTRGSTTIRFADFLEPRLRPVSDINLEPLDADFRPGTSRTQIAIFAAVAILIVAIASINFMNLSTARATQRAREVAVRKAMGATRTQLVVQFIGESVVLTLLGLVLALALVELVLPAFSGVVGRDLALDPVGDPTVLPLLVGLAALVGIAGGAYPALFLSRFNPARVLKANTGSQDGGGGRLRAALVVAQFAIAIALMVTTAVVYGQFRYAQNKDLGFDKENVVLLDGLGRPDVAPARTALLDALRADPRIAAVGVTDSVPTGGNQSNTNVRVVGRAEGEPLVFRSASVDESYFETLGMRLVAGRSFDTTRGTDAITRPAADPATAQPPAAAGETRVTSASVVLNREATRRLGAAGPEEALGLVLEVSDGPGSLLRLTVIGVMEDFHFGAVRDAIPPALFVVDPQSVGTAAVRVKAGELGAAVDAIDRIWREVLPDVPVQRSFLDERVADQYGRERQIAGLFAGFAGLAILISCLGLFALAAFTAERRTKEIGLRKVLGAGVTDIVRLLVWQFSKPVLLANLIAWPVAWLAMGRWLEGFAYRIDLDPLPFLAAGAAALAIAWLTVGLHAARVAQAKPIVALRYE